MSTLSEVGVVGICTAILAMYESEQEKYWLFMCHAMESVLRRGEKSRQFNFLECKAFQFSLWDNVSQTVTIIIPQLH